MRASMQVKKTISRRMESKKSKVADPVREVIQQVKTAGVALGQLLTSMSRSDNEVNDGQEAAFCLTVSRSKISGVILEFSTSSPGRRQTIQLLLIGDKAFLQIPGSEKLVKQIKQLARFDETSIAQARGKARLG